MPENLLNGTAAPSGSAAITMDSTSTSSMRPQTDGDGKPIPSSSGNSTPGPKKAGGFSNAERAKYRMRIFQLARQHDPRYPRVFLYHSLIEGLLPNTEEGRKLVRQTAKLIRQGWTLDPWELQDCRVHVWIQGPAAIACRELCERLRVPLFQIGFRGFAHCLDALEDANAAMARGQEVIALIWGDCTDSPIDSPDRIVGSFYETWGAPGVKAIRLGLDQKHVDLFRLPRPSRSKSHYCSGELTAVPPSTFRAWVEMEILRHVDAAAWITATGGEAEQPMSQRERRRV